MKAALSVGAEIRDRAFGVLQALAGLQAGRKTRLRLAAHSGFLAFVSSRPGSGQALDRLLRRMARQRGGYQALEGRQALGRVQGGVAQQPRSR